MIFKATIFFTNMYKCQENFCKFVISRSNASKLFDFIEKSLDFFTKFIKFLIVLDSFLPILFGRNYRIDIVFCNRLRFLLLS